ncbi:MAG TPA: HAMP domain-containing sensor histidine kinase [Paucimonas sp.]|nr:HAMP domain-containing sensor histidine kinase [Paucimonas sp.]
MTLPLLFSGRLRRMKWFDAYFFGVITYIFPFFFTFMFLMNEGSSEWAQSLLIAVIVLFHFGTKFATLSFLLGIALAYIAYSWNIGYYDELHPDIQPSIPIVAFAILTVSIVKIGRNILIEEKLKAMASALGTVSHELRTPLRSVDASARGLKRYLPALVAFYEKHHRAEQADLLVAGRVLMMDAALDRIQADVQYMNSAIDLLLANASDAKRRGPGAESFEVAGAIMEAVNRYPFESEQQHAQVSVNIDVNFPVTGNRDLFIMVMFNLLKNGLRAIARAGKGEIHISTARAENGHQMIFHDTGCGIPKTVLPHLFSRFYSYPPNSGTGIGLAFCRDTLETWGATILCHSRLGDYTEFVIQFPDAEQKAAGV